MKHSDTKNVNSKLHTRNLTLIGLMAAIICILGPLSLYIPFSPVPISLTNLAVLFSIYVLGMKKGTLSYLIYLLLGLMGVPVFSSFTGGPAKLFGPTGGYLLGFILLAVISGLFIDKWPQNMVLCLLGMILGVTVCNLFGTVWLSFQAGMSFPVALAAGVLPFIPGDLIKCMIAMLAGTQIRKRLNRAGFV